ncbi:MAG: FAD-binding protein, partial [Caldithrix sp.]|nr:FAD-binding protein [Caldithrix sp.]
VSHVYLDAHSYITAQKIKTNFPNIYEQALKVGVDMTRDLLPVVPAAHYACGGIWVDEWGRTTLNHFYATGEVACTGVHGANRLASTSLMEGVVWAFRTAEEIKRSITDIRKADPSKYPLWQDEGHELPDPVLIKQDMSFIKHIMWNYVGLVRTKHRLQRALRELRNLENEIERFYRVARLTDELIGLRNAVRTAIIVTSSAWSNKQSMGCHYRE